MRTKIISLLALTALASLAVLGTPQTKEQRYNARVVVQATSSETYEFTSTDGKETSKGSSNFQITYSQNFTLTAESGYVSLPKSVGAPSSSVNGTASTTQTMESNPSNKQTFTETFSSAPHSENNDADAGSGTASAIVIQGFKLNGEGLAFRILTAAQLKGSCTSTLAPGNICLGNALTNLEGPDDNTSAHTAAAPMVMNAKINFDFYGKADPADPSIGTCDACFLGGDVHGDLNAGYKFTGTGTKTTNAGGWKRTWKTSVNGQISILNKM